MWQLVNVDEVGRRALMLILGGEGWAAWLDEGSAPTIYARISTLSTTGDEPIGQRLFGVFVDRESFPGGYRYPETFHANPQAGEQ
jgi:hypothetical protein